MSAAAASASPAHAPTAVDSDLEFARLLQQQEMLLYSMQTGGSHALAQGACPEGGEQQLDDEELARRLQMEEEQYAARAFEHMGEQLEAVEAEVESLRYEGLQALGEAVGTVSKGLPAESLQRLSSQPYKDLHGAACMERCCICQDEFEEEEAVTQLPSCMHVYHQECIAEWLSRNKTCPYCNKEVDAIAAAAPEH